MISLEALETLDEIDALGAHRKGSGGKPIGPEDLPVNSVAAVGNAATFEFATADGAVPAIELPNDNGMCANVARLSVQP